jgi:hypothetical protein
MKERPTSVTVIAWILIVMGALSLITSAHTYTLMKQNPMALDLLRKSMLPVSVQIVIMFISILIDTISGIAMLKGHNWARLLYIISYIVRLTISLFTSPVKLMIIPGIVLFLVVAFFLFRPKANEFFLPSAPDYLQQRRHRAMRKVLGILFYVVAGFLLNIVCYMSFLKSPLWVKSAMMGTFFIPGAIALVIGLTINRFRNWKREVGIVFVSGAGTNAFLFFTMICFFCSPELDLKKYFSDNTPDILTDFVSGIGCILLFMVVGIVLIRSSRKEEPASPI